MHGETLKYGYCSFNLQDGGSIPSETSVISYIRKRCQSLEDINLNF